MRVVLSVNDVTDRIAYSNEFFLPLSCSQLFSSAIMSVLFFGILHCSECSIRVSWSLRFMRAIRSPKACLRRSKSITDSTSVDHNRQSNQEEKHWPQIKKENFTSVFQYKAFPFIHVPLISSPQLLPIGILDTTTIR